MSDTPDMLVRLHALPDARAPRRRVVSPDLDIRGAEPSDLGALRDFALEHFGEVWANGVPVAFTHEPVSAFVAVEEDAIVGFALYDIAYRAYFGPLGVREDCRQRGIGAALVLHALDAMRDRGYAYAVIGKAGDPGFYERACGAVVIDGERAP